MQLFAICKTIDICLLIEKIIYVFIYLSSIYLVIYLFIYFLFFLFEYG